MCCDLPSKPGAVILQWATLTLRKKAQEWNLELSELGKLKTRLDGMCLEKEVQRWEPENPLCWVSPRMMPLSFSSQLDHILSPPPMPFRKCSNPDVACGLGKSLKYKRQLSGDGKQLRRGSLGGALTGESGQVGQRRNCTFLTGSWTALEFCVWKPACRPFCGVLFSPESSLN